MSRSSFLVASSALALLALAGAGSPLGAQTRRPDGRAWFVDAGVTALRVPESAAANITTRGIAPLATLRVGRAVAPRLAIALSVAYGEAGNARHDVYERPSGPTRTETYDYRALLALVGTEYALVASRAELFTGLEGGWFAAGWRVDEYEDPAGFAAPRSSFGGGVVGVGLLGARYRFAERAAVSLAVRGAAGQGTFEGSGGGLLTEAALRWQF